MFIQAKLVETGFTKNVDKRGMCHMQLELSKLMSQSVNIPIYQNSAYP